MVAAAAVLAAAVPDLLQGAASLTVRSSALVVRDLQRFDPPPDPGRQPLVLLRGDLLDRLAEGDRAWDPTAEFLPDGSTRYHYRRRPDEPEPSLEELRRRIASPPSYNEERRAVIRLLNTLQQAGVQLELTPPLKPGAAAEWDPANRTLRIHPSVPDKGSLDFARVLNHEAIHVAQSCRAGGLRAAPTPLGIAGDLNPAVASELDGPTYAGSGPLVRRLESEAYANQHRLHLGDDLVRRHCRLKA